MILFLGIDGGGAHPRAILVEATGRDIATMTAAAERATDDLGRCFAVAAGPGEVVVVPPGWAHATISADPRQPLTFGAWCVRDYGFDDRDVRAHGGLAWFPCFAGDELRWEPNTRYPVATELIFKAPASYDQLGLRTGVPIWRQCIDAPESVMWVPRPEKADACWGGFIP